MKTPKEFGKLRRLFSRKEKFKILILFIMMLIAAVLEVIGIGMIPAFVSIVANPQRVLEHETFGPFFQRIGIEEARELLVYGAIALVGIFVIKNAYILFFRFIEARFIYTRQYVFSRRLMTAYMQAPYTFYLQRNTSELLRNLANDIHIIIKQVLSNILKIAKEGIMSISIFLFLLMIEPLITLFVIIVMGGISGVFLLITQKKLKRFGKEDLKCRHDMIMFAQQGFGGIKDARVLNRENNFIERFCKTAYHSSQLHYKQQYMGQIPRPVIETLAVFSIMLIALVMQFQGRPIASIIPVIAMFGVAIVRLMPSIQQITQLLTNLRYSIVSVNPVYDDLKELEAYSRSFVADRSRNEKTTLINAIKIQNLHYHYPESTEQALNGVTLEIPKGKAVAFVGPSGAGKTTIVDVLLGLLVPQKGKILVDEKNVFDSISSWQRNIGYIPQFIYLSDDTLRRNIAFGLPDDQIKEENILKTVELAQLSELVARLPAGLDTIIGERGTRLSGGQRQRIGIARALYHDPQVLVMDEATSSLDNITEQQIIQSIEALKGNHTIIMIAHRLTTVMNCDELFLMENGKIIDKGTYSELLERNDKFKEMALEKNL